MTANEREYNGQTLYQIRALYNIPPVSNKYGISSEIVAGDLGGWVSSPSARISGHAWLHEGAIALNGSELGGHARVHGSTVLDKGATVTDRTLVTGVDNYIGGDTLVEDRAVVAGNVEMSGYVTIGGSAVVGGTFTFSSGKQLSKKTTIRGAINVGGD